MVAERLVSSHLLKPDECMTSQIWLLFEVETEKSLNRSNYNFFLEGSHPICISGTRTFLICLANNAIRLEEEFSKHAAELVSKMSACTEPDWSFNQI